MRSLFVAAALAFTFTAPTLVGCKDKDKKEEASADKGEKGDKADKKKKKTSEGFTRGEVLSHVPKSCKTARIYLDIAGILRTEAVITAAGALQDKLTEAMEKGNDKKGAKAMKALKKAGIDLTKDLKEVAICLGGSEKEITVAIGGDFAGKEPLEALGKAGEAAGEDAPAVKEVDGVKYMKLDKKGFAGLVSPNVIVFTEDKDSLPDLAKANDQSKEWGAGKSKLISFKGTEKKAGDFEGAFEEKGDDLIFTVTMDVKGLDMKGASDAKVKTQLEAIAAEIAKKFKGPLKKVGEALEATKFTVDGSTVTVKFTIASADLGEVVKKLASMDEKGLKETIDL